jgi:hypothetical protein
MSKIKPPSRPTVGQITAPKIISDNENIMFAFSYFRPDHEICAGGQDAEYFHALLDRLKAVCSIKAKDFKLQHAGHAGGNPKALRAHPIDWNHPKVTQVGFGIPQRNDLNDIAWQFSLSKHTLGRVHGFLIDRVFYVVWLDPHHKLYPWAQW